MWTRFARTLRCVVCEGELALHPIEQRTAAVEQEQLAQGERQGIGAADLCSAVDEGLLVCQACRLWFPILHGLPILLPYGTPLHDELAARHPAALRRLGRRFRRPHETPAPGEEFVLRSFSREWLDYDYDGVLWTWSYEDREAMFLGEIGRDAAPPDPCRFLEIGCGLGLVTSFAAKNFPGDAVGVDLSLAALRAARHFRNHPFLHFVQASLYQLPLPSESFDLVYSHGVLHHTFSTEAALASIAAHCKPGGRLYAWVYGMGSIDEDVFRRLAYGVEVALRPILSRLPPDVANVVLAPMATAYVAINWLQRKRGEPRQPYDFGRALHAARDRLTPAFAHRAEGAQVERWLEELGFEEIRQVSELEVPPSARTIMRRNVGMRGRRRLAAPVAAAA